ncbi:MAG: peptidase S26 [Mesorhizobium sp. SCN 65-20]|nr:MAG: peptidase S26 [Mesorhizobium sp. SCN 65-20]
MSRRGIILATTVAAMSVVYAAIKPVPVRLVWNASASVPIGLYIIDPDGSFEVEDLVAVNTPEPLATLLAERGYLPEGVPLLKRVRAHAGQTVCRSDVVITVDGREAGRALERDRAGRPLPAWGGCLRIPTGKLFLMNGEVRDSLDGRYFGLTSTDRIIGRATPLWTDGRGIGCFEWRAQTR